MCQPHRFFFQSPCALAGRLYPIPALAQRIFRLAFVRLGGSAAARGSLHGAAVDAQFRRIGGVAHLLLGGEDDFRGGVRAFFTSPSDSEVSRTMRSMSILFVKYCCVLGWAILFVKYCCVLGWAKYTVCPLRVPIGCTFDLMSNGIYG